MRTTKTDIITATWRGDDTAREVTDGAVRGLNVAVEYLDSEVTPLTPYLTGDLNRSKTVKHATGSEPVAVISFKSPYAWYQHELNTRNRTRDPNPRAQSKYLEGPFMTHRARLLQIIAQATRGDRA